MQKPVGNGQIKSVASVGILVGYSGFGLTAPLKS